ncbi:MAG TPA: glycerol-3-phosphate acyltransferase [Candidatus Cryosericum sp.]|nr:glycerol-3-phosphate acyltransferase [Candidatus Cryosericum sp.]
MTQPFVDTLVYSTAGFLFGSVLYSAYLPRWIKGIDTTEVSEDKNPGAYNAFHYAGAVVGSLCLACDVAKGFLPVMLASKVIPPAYPLFSAVMLAPVAGHAFSPLRRFHGGKGIAVSFGVLLALAPHNFVVLSLVGAYLGSLLLPLRPNERRTVAAFTAFGLLAMLFRHPVSIKAGCLLIALLVNYKNWQDANLPILRIRNHI